VSKVRVGRVFRFFILLSLKTDVGQSSQFNIHQNSVFLIFLLDSFFLPFQCLNILWCVADDWLRGVVVPRVKMWLTSILLTHSTLEGLRPLSTNHPLHTRVYWGIGTEEKSNRARRLGTPNSDGYRTSVQMSETNNVCPMVFSTVWAMCLRYVSDGYPGSSSCCL
jgi:hypothetical protein